jgi:pimeloyl-ACP methyl ester carboxylesterase
MEAFLIDVPDNDLVELRRRLAGTRLPPDGATSYGVPSAVVRALVDHWLRRYDWRVWEARLNAYPQFTTTIDGANVHFLHVRSPEPDAVPLILSHGWPGSVAEFLEVIGPLSDPAAYGLNRSIAFHLVIPSLPNFAWSGPTPDAGWGPRRIARAWATLMRRLGYHRYGAAGNDWGSHISTELGRVAPAEVVGVHVTQLFSFPDGESLSYPPSTEPSDDLSPSDRRALDALREVQRTMSAYSHVHAQQPQTLAYALSDSPVGLLAWNSQVMGGLEPDVLLTHVAIHWLTGTAGSALRIYADSAAQETPAAPTTVPLGLAQFADDLRSIRRYAARDHANIVSWNEYDTGGHYAAQQTPDLLVHDLRQFFSAVLTARKKMTIR